MAQTKDQLPKNRVRISDKFAQKDAQRAAQGLPPRTTDIVTERAKLIREAMKPRHVRLLEKDQEEPQASGDAPKKLTDEELLAETECQKILSEGGKLENILQKLSQLSQRLRESKKGIRATLLVNKFKKNISLLSSDELCRQIKECKNKLLPVVSPDDAARVRRVARGMGDHKTIKNLRSKNSTTEALVDILRKDIFKRYTFALAALEKLGLDSNGSAIFSTKAEALLAAAQDEIVQHPQVQASFKSPDFLAFRSANADDQELSSLCDEMDTLLLESCDRVAVVIAKRRAQVIAQLVDQFCNKKLNPVGECVSKTILAIARDEVLQVNATKQISSASINLIARPDRAIHAKRISPKKKKKQVQNSIPFVQPMNRRFKWSA